MEKPQEATADGAVDQAAHGNAKTTTIVGHDFVGSCCARVLKKPESVHRQP